MRRNIVALACALALAACGQTTVGPEEIAPSDTQAAGDGEFCRTVEAVVSPTDCAALDQMAALVRPGWASFRVPESMQRDHDYVLVLAMSRRTYEPPPPPEPAEPAAAEEPAATDSGETAAPPASAAPEQTAAQEEPAPDPAAPSDREAAGAEQTPDENAVAEQPLNPREMVETVPGMLHEFAPPVGRYMEVQLNHDGGFEITALSPTGQVVTDDGASTTWQWRVRPTSQGARHLELRTVAMGCLDEKRERCFLFRQTAYPYTIDVSVGWWGQFLDWLKQLPDIFKIITAAIVALTSLVGAIFGLRAALRKGRSGEA